MSEITKEIVSKEYELTMNNAEFKRRLGINANHKVVICHIANYTLMGNEFDYVRVVVQVNGVEVEKKFSN